MHRWELKESQRRHKEHLATIKPSIDLKPPVAMPHLTLYGRDYVAKKKATTEAAFADLKMIQAIAKTMTRSASVPERKGPVSLNADSRKAQIYKVMAENHRLLEHIDNVGAFCDTREILAEHRYKRRYVINASHTCRLSGEYDEEIKQIAREDDFKVQTQKRSTQLRRDAAERMKKNTGSISLPSLTGASSSEPSVPPHAKQGALRRACPQKGWQGEAGDANKADAKKATRLQAKGHKPKDPANAPVVPPSEPPAQRQGVQFRPAELLEDASSSASASEATGAEMGDTASKRQELLNRQATPAAPKMAAPPSDDESEASEAGDQAAAGAGEIGEGVLYSVTLEDDPVYVEDDVISQAPTPQARAPRKNDEAGFEPEAAAQLLEEPPPVESDDVLPTELSVPDVGEEIMDTAAPPTLPPVEHLTEAPSEDAETTVKAVVPPTAAQEEEDKDDDKDENYENSFEDDDQKEESYSQPSSQGEAPKANAEAASGEAEASPPPPVPEGGPPPAEPEAEGNGETSYGSDEFDDSGEASADKEQETSNSGSAPKAAPTVSVSRADGDGTEYENDFAEESGDKSEAPFEESSQAFEASGES